MAKYRITSIPQARYGGVFNKTTKIMKGRKDNESSTDQEQPMVEVENVAQPSYWNEMQSPVMTGKQCPPGKYDYNGQCLTESELRAAWAEEQKGFEKQMSDRKLAHEQKIQESRQRLYDELVKNETTFRENKWNEYQNTYKNSKKSDKIEPFDRIPLTEFSKEREDQFKQARFLVNKNKETGFAELYPIELAYDRIINNGYQADQFKNYWGLDPKQVKEQLGPLMDAAKQQYDATVTNKIITKALEEGKSPAEVVKSLPSSLGNQTELKKFIQPTQKILNNALGTITQGLDSMQTDNTKLAKDQDVFFSNDPQAAWEKRYHPAETDLKYHSDKIERGQKAFNEWMDKYGNIDNSDIRYSQDDQMAMQRNANQLSRDAVILRDAEAKRTSAENQDYNKAVSEYLGNLVLPAQRDVLKKAISELNDKEKSSFINLYQTDPNAAVQSILGKKVSGSKKTYQDLLQEQQGDIYNAAIIHSGQQIKQGDPNRELTTEDKVKDVLKHPFHSAYYALNPREEMWGDWNRSYIDRLKAEDKFGTDLGTMSKLTPTGVLDQTLNPFNPFKIGMNLREGYDEGNFTEALGKELWDVGTAYGGIKGLNAIGKGTGFFKPVVSNMLGNPFVDASVLLGLDQNLADAKESFNKGNYGEAAWDASMAGLSALPAYRFAKGIKSVPTNYTNFSDFTMPTQQTQKGLDARKLLGYSKGGTLPKANLGQIVKAGTKLTKAAKPAVYLMESPGLRVTVPEFESLVNENLAKGLGIKKIDDQLKVKINPVTESSFDLSGNPLLRLDMSTYVGNNLTGDIGITRFDKGQHGIPTLEDQLIFMKERDYPFGLSDRFNLMGTGVSGEFNKAITNSLQQVGLNPLVSSGMHTQEGRKRWDDLTKKGHATQLHKHFYMLHKNGGVALELTQKEIDQYVKDGYIVEDE